MSWTPQTDLEPVALSWADYRARTAGPITEADWPRYRSAAEAVVDQVTFGAAALVTDTVLLNKVRQAICVTADALLAAAGGVVSESLGGYSYTKAEPMTPAVVDRIACRALARTGLCYKGAYPTDEYAVTTAETI